jgi:hypothetical protein
MTIDAVMRLIERTPSVSGEFSVMAKASCPNAVETFSCSAPGLLEGLSIDPGNGINNCTLGCNASANSPCLVTVVVTDDGSPLLSDGASFAWTVLNTDSVHYPHQCWSERGSLYNLFPNHRSKC